MSVVLQPLGVKCNIQCRYCYQNPERDAGNVSHAYDLQKMKAAIENEGGPFLLFGGEPLLIPERDLEELWSWGYQKYGSNSVQTNATLIKDSHLRMFRKYNVSIGISIDGPAELNNLRWHKNVARTREATAKTSAAIERLCKEEIIPGLIVTLHRFNATCDRLPEMHDWFRYLEHIGITSVRLHILEADTDFIRQQYALSTNENLVALLSFLKLEQEELTTLKFDVFADMRNLLLGEDENVTCIWDACDPYTTEAVRGIDGKAQISNCNMVNKDGIGFTKSNEPGFERYLALCQTPQEYGGCKDCRFFLMCKGHCPGNAIDGDWRNRTEYCEVWKGLYRRIEEQILDAGLIPLSRSPVRKELEGIFLAAWAQGSKQSIRNAKKLLEFEVFAER